MTQTSQTTEPEPKQYVPDRGGGGGGGGVLERQLYDYSRFRLINLIKSLKNNIYKENFIVFKISLGSSGDFLN